MRIPDSRCAPRRSTTTRERFRHAATMPPLWLTSNWRQTPPSPPASSGSGMVEQDSGSKKAIESAKTWNLKLSDPHLAKELQAGVVTEMAVSCAAGKWDGDDPPADRGAFCRSVLERKMNSLGNTTGSQLQSEIIGLAANLVAPFALKFTGMFWDVHGRYHILEGLAQGVGSNSGHYTFTKK